MAADLSGYAREHSSGEIREAISHGAGASDARGQTGVIITRDGERYVGVVRNEDNFSVQFQTLDGVFHFFMKADISQMEMKPSLMPQNYASTLSQRDLDNIVSYLVDSAKARNEEESREGND